MTTLTAGRAENVDHFDSVKMKHDTAAGAARHILHFIRLQGDLFAP